MGTPPELVGATDAPLGSTADEMGAPPTEAVPARTLAMSASTEPDAEDGAATVTDALPRTSPQTWSELADTESCAASAANQVGH